MPTKQEIAKILSDAWSAKDEALMRTYMHDNFHFKGPMMEMNSLEEIIAAMKDCPFESTCQNSETISQDDKVVHICDWVVTAPFQDTIPCVEILEFEGEKVKRSRLFFDTARFPAEFTEQMNQQTA